MADAAPRTPLDDARSRLRQPLVRIGLVLGLLPFVAGLLFRTYTYRVSPAWYEGLRQFDFPFIAVELAIFCYAREKGLNLRELFGAIDRRCQAALVIFLATFWLGSIFASQNPAYSGLRAGFWFVHLGFGCAVYHLCRQRDAGAERGFFWAIALGFLACLPTIAVHIALAPDPSTLPEGQIIWQSALPGFLSVRQFGFLAAVVLALALGQSWRPDDRGGAVAVPAIVAISTAALMWSGTRAGVVGVLAALVAVVAVRRGLPPARAMATNIAAVAIGAWASTLYVLPDAAFGIVSLTTQGAQSVDEVSSGRLTLWLAGWDAFLSSPLLGTGEGSFYWLSPVGRGYHVQPHNFVVQMLMSWGLPAAIAAFYLLWRIWAAAHRLATSTAALVPIVMMIDCLIAMAMLDGVLYASRTLMLVIAGFAVCLVHARQTENLPLAEPKPA